MDSLFITRWGHVYVIEYAKCVDVHPMSVIGGMVGFSKSADNFQYQGVLVILNNNRTKLTMLAACAGWVFWIFFSRLSYMFSFFLKRLDID